MVTLLVLGPILTLATLTIFHQYLPQRQNFTGQNIPTAIGIILLPIILLTLVSGMIGGGVGSLDVGAACFLVYVALAGVVGFVDDLWGGVDDKGFSGHLGALARGRVTTGLVKIAVLGAGALVVGVCEIGFGWEAVVGGIILAGSANLANLLDLRPGRALKFVGIPVVGLMVFSVGGGAFVVAGIVGGLFGVFYFDLRGRIMLGDAGAAILGGVMGFLILLHGPGIFWWFSLVAIIGLTLVAEFFSFSRIIEEVAFLRRFDAWGRRVNER